MKYDNWLNNVLDNRELRQKKQLELINKFNSTILSLTINIPGSEKNTKDAKFIYEIALKEIAKLSFKVYEKILTCKDTGYEALFCLRVDAKKLKTLTCKIEDTHPLGRFMDMDVIDKNKNILSRKSPRKCYICNLKAKDCARAQTHALEELQNFISKKVDDYRLSL